METINQIIDGLNIIKKYSDDICADHDIIYVGNNIKVSDEDAKKLDDLGWHWDNDFQSWARFV